jgi:putative flippase GtrA
MSPTDRSPSAHAGLLWFGVSGVLALGVDVGVLALAQGALGHYGGRLLSFWAAATFTWGFNRRVSFAGARSRAQALGAEPGAQPQQPVHQLPLCHEYLGYLGSMAVGGALNFGTYAAAVATLPLVHAHPGLGVALGSLVGTGFNYLAARRILVR